MERERECEKKKKKRLDLSFCFIPGSCDSPETAAGGSWASLAGDGRLCQRSVCLALFPSTSPRNLPDSSAALLFPRRSCRQIECHRGFVPNCPLASPVPGTPESLGPTRKDGRTQVRSEKEEMFYPLPQLLTEVLFLSLTL